MLGPPGLDILVPAPELHRKVDHEDIVTPPDLIEQSSRQAGVDGGGLKLPLPDAIQVHVFLGLGTLSSRHVHDLYRLPGQ